MAKFADLKHGDLRKRGGDRLKVFLEKVKTGEAFLTKKGEVILDKSQLKLLESTMDTAGFNAIMTGKKGSQKIELKYPADFYKSPEFGGKGIGFGTQAEDRFLALFRKEIEKALLKGTKPYFNLRIAGRTVKVADIYQPKGTPKSDFNLVDHEGNDVGFLSHKAGSKPSDFQQYGGLSHSTFAANQEVKQFMLDAAKMFPNGLKRGESIMRRCKNKSVQYKSIYGVDYGKKPGKDNVDEFHQGEMKLVKSGSNYKITSGHPGTNGDLPRAGSGYECYYYARFTSDRGANIANVFLGNARVGVFPRGTIPRTCIEI